MKTKTIRFTEYAYVLHAYQATVEISMEDFENLEIHRKNIQTISEKLPSFKDIKSKGPDTFKSVETIYSNILKVEEQNINTILEKYNADYDCSEPLYDDSYVDSYEYDGEV